MLPLSHSRSRLPGRRLGDMRPDGAGALRGEGGWGGGAVSGGGNQNAVRPSRGAPRTRQSRMYPQILSMLLSPYRARASPGHAEHESRKAHPWVLSQVCDLSSLAPYHTPRCTHTQMHTPRGHLPHKHLHVQAKLTETWASSRQGYRGPRWPPWTETGWTESRFC